MDGASAFYAALRELLYDGENNMSDQERSVRVVEKLHPAEDLHWDILAMLMGPSVLQEAGVPHILRRFVATTLARTYYTMSLGGSNYSSVWATTTRVTPGSPLADAFFQAIFIHSLDEFETRIRGMPGENAVEQSEAATVDLPPVATLVDDEATLVEVEAPAMLVGRMSAIVTHAQAALAHVGVKANFDAGKTEVMFIFVGKHSRQQKLKWLAVHKP